MYFKNIVSILHIFQANCKKKKNYFWKKNLVKMLFKKNKTLESSISLKNLISSKLGHS